MATVLSLIALAVAAGSDGPHAIAEFAASLNHASALAVALPPAPGGSPAMRRAQWRTFRRLLKRLMSSNLKRVLVGWMAREDPRRAEVLHLDGKQWSRMPRRPRRWPRPRNRPRRSRQNCRSPKPTKPLTLVNFVTDQQRLVDQVAVPANTNEEAAVAAHWPSMDWPGVCHDRCRPHHQGQRAATHPGQRGRLPPDTQGQSTRGLRQSPIAPRGRFSPLRPAPSKRGTGGLKTGRCGAWRSRPRPWDWPARPRCCAWTARSIMSAAGKWSNTPRRPSTRRPVSGPTRPGRPPCWPWCAVTGRSRTASIIGGIAPRTRIAVRWRRPTRRGCCPCFAP
ncbi:MAG: hypothetical protein H7A45_15680 [Verrucomicrobiales bacterium]|nr:hypothetical protein [Verrucomicrobiales bacterium]